VKVMVVRPGFVRTKMTAGMEEAPFATTPDKVAEAIVTGLTDGAETIWVPGILAYAFLVFRNLPRALWRRIADR
jgi:decaprenylphospho-beta-D-erythro-pentofuranosid-2-ulose 2-reductase